MKIKVIGFDLDDTLWAVRPVIIRAEQSLNDWLRQRVPELQFDVEQMRQFRDRALGEQPELANQITELRRRVIHIALTESGVSEATPIADEAIDVFLEARNDIEFFDGAMDVLHALSTRYSLGALSNGNADISRIGLSHLFSFAFSAEQVGAPKPEPDLFHHAIDHSQIEPAEMIYVGDDPKLDVDAANALGIETIWLDHGTKPKGDTEPSAIISNIRELPDAVYSVDPSRQS